ncbi:MAG: ATP-binding protein [Caulobacter sp.]|nr:ATP-binding protein [Caulobacter sp.]
MRPSLIACLVLTLVASGVAVAKEQPTPIDPTSIEQDPRAERLADQIETRKLLSTVAKRNAWEAAAQAARGADRLERMRQITTEAMSSSDMPRINRWMALYEREIADQHDTDHEPALAQLKAYRRGMDGDYSGAVATLTRMIAGETDPFLRAAGARLLSYTLTDAGQPVQALRVVRSGLRDAAKVGDNPSLRVGLSDAWAYAALEMEDLPTFIEQVEAGVAAAAQTEQPYDGMTALYNLASLSSRQGHAAEAARLLERYQLLALATFDPTEIYWANELCSSVSRDAGDYARARVCAEQALAHNDISPEHEPKIMLTRVIALARLGRATEARSRLTEVTALALRRNDPELLDTLVEGEAEVLRSEGRLAEAFDALNRFHRQNSHNKAAAVVQGVREMRSSLEGEIDQAQALLDAQRRQSLLFAILIGVGVIVTLGGGWFLLAVLRLQRRLVAAADRAERADRVKSEFLANMSHEIRTPLTSIVGFSRLLVDQPDLPAESGRFAERILTATRSLLAIVNDVLDFSKLEAGQVTIDPRPVAAATLAEDVASLFESQTRAKGISLDVDASPELPELVSVDPDRLRQVLLNLIGNAVKFTAAGGVRVGLSWSEPDVLHVEVTDTGEGISEEGRAMLFRRFSQVDGSATRVQGGTGLGLAICQGLVDAMGGEIGVDSVPGKGSRFWFRIAAPQAAAPEPEPEATPRTLGARGAARVLVVDDNDANRELVTHLLSGLDLELSLAISGEEAIAAAEAGAFDLILMDIRMPGMGGEAAMKIIRANGGSNASAPILAFTADADRESAERLREAGFDGHVCKPIDPRALMMTVMEWTAAA